MNLEELEDLLSHPTYHLSYNHYQIPQTQKQHWKLFRKDLWDYHLEIERNNRYNIAPLFDELTEALHRFPTQAEYIYIGLMRASYTQEEETGTNPVQDTEERAKLFIQTLRNRLARTYVSNLIEEYTALQLLHLYPKAKIYKHTHLDLILGVDIVLELHSRLYYIHITTNTKWGLKKLPEKEKKEWFKVTTHTGEEKWFNYKRDFTNHILLAYDPYYLDQHENSIYKNNLPIFKEEYIKEQLASVSTNQLEFDTPPNTLATFSDSLIEEGVVPNGFEFKAKQNQDHKEKSINESFI